MRDISVELTWVTMNRKMTHPGSQIAEGTRRCARRCFGCSGCRSRSQSRSSSAGDRESSVSRSCESCWGVGFQRWIPHYNWIRSGEKAPNGETVRHNLLLFSCVIILLRCFWLTETMQEPFWLFGHRPGEVFFFFSCFMFPSESLT